MQNSVVKEFAGHPQVVTLVMNEGGANGETVEWIKTFWNQCYLRGSTLIDSTKAQTQHYRQPSTGLPFSRGFIIDQEGIVALPYFGHQPQRAIAAIYALLDNGCCVGIRGNINGDAGQAIDISDLVYLVDYMFTNGPEPPCMDEANVNGFGDIDISDLVYLVDYMFLDGPAPAACE
jgi:hypothetical protein